MSGHIFLRNAIFDFLSEATDADVQDPYELSVRLTAYLMKRAATGLDAGPTIGELLSVADWPAVIDAVADKHDIDESEASSMDPEVFADSIEHYRERRIHLRALAKEINESY